MKTNICTRNKCIKCCIQTSMLLSNDDVEKIKNLGYNVNDFSRAKKGWLKLKNKNGKCVFHDGKICLIYDSKPEGCKLYPLIFSKDYNSAIVDEECPYVDSFKFNANDLKKLDDLINRILIERKQRKKKQNKKFN